MIGMDEIGNYTIGTEGIPDPSKAYYIIGLGETDNYWVNGGQGDVSQGESPDSWENSRLIKRWCSFLPREECRIPSLPPTRFVAVSLCRS